MPLQLGEIFREHNATFSHYHTPASSSWPPTRSGVGLANNNYAARSRLQKMTKAIEYVLWILTMPADRHAAERRGIFGGLFAPNLPVLRTEPCKSTRRGTHHQTSPHVFNTVQQPCSANWRPLRAEGQQQHLLGSVEVVCPIALLLINVTTTTTI